VLEQRSGEPIVRSVAFGRSSGLVCWGLLAAPAVHAADVTIGNLVITRAWSRATPGVAEGSRSPSLPEAVAGVTRSRWNR
jgi:hypothetical protein